MAQPSKGGIISPLTLIKDKEWIKKNKKNNNSDSALIPFIRKSNISSNSENTVVQLRDSP